jgi:hypothetical protein
MVVVGRRRPRLLQSPGTHVTRKALDPCRPHPLGIEGPAGPRSQHRQSFAGGFDPLLPAPAWDRGPGRTSVPISLEELDRRCPERPWSPGIMGLHSSRDHGTEATRRPWNLATHPAMYRGCKGHPDPMRQGPEVHRDHGDKLREAPGWHGFRRHGSLGGNRAGDREIEGHRGIGADRPSFRRTLGPSRLGIEATGDRGTLVARKRLNEGPRIIR